MIVVLVYKDSAVHAVSSFFIKYRLLLECVPYWDPHPPPFLEATILLCRLTFSCVPMNFTSIPSEMRVDTAGCNCNVPHRNQSCLSQLCTAII